MTICGECFNNHNGSARPCVCFDEHTVDRLVVEVDLIREASVERVKVNKWMLKSKGSDTNPRTSASEDTEYPCNTRCQSGCQAANSEAARRCRCGWKVFRRHTKVS